MIGRIAALFAFALWVTGAAHAQTTPPANDESSWEALVDEPSRGALFEQLAEAQAKAQAKTFAFPTNFLFPTSASNDVDGTPRTNSIFGVDISHHNGAAFPLALLKRQQVRFVYTKATQGTTYADKTFGTRWSGLKALPAAQRIPRGAYHFLSSRREETGTQQADRFLAYVALHGGFEEGDLRPALDLEWDKTCESCPDRWAVNHRTAKEILDTTLDFVRRVKAKTGWTPLIYSNKSFLVERGFTTAQIQLLLGARKAWIFNLAKNDRQLEVADPAKNLPYALWQFSWVGSLTSGNGGKLDVDVFKGTEAEFKALFLTKS